MSTKPAGPILKPAAPVLVALALAMFGSGVAAASAPQIDAVAVDGGAVAGREASFGIRAADPEAPIAGVTLSFDGDSFGSSACRLEGPGGGPATGPFANGSAVTVSVPHSFGAAGARDGVARVVAGGCGKVTGTAAAVFTATVTEPGQPLVPVALGTPLPLELPKIPGLPALIPVAAASACEGANTRIRARSAPSRARAIAALLCLVNRERTRSGLAPLTANPRLEAAALAHSRAMVRRRFFSHYGTRPPGRSLEARLRRSRYLPAPGFVVGENLAYGRRITPKRLVQAWMASTTHRVNVLSPDYRELGMGISPGRPVGSRGSTFTVDFGVIRR